MFKSRTLTLIVLAALLAVIALTIREAIVTSAVVQEVNVPQSQQAAREADVARWAGLGEYYAAQPSQNLDASAARWAAMGQYYTALEAGQMERGRAADVARWVGLGEYYSRK